MDFLQGLYDAVVSFFTNFFSDMAQLIVDALSWLLDGFILVISFTVLFIIQGFFTVISTLLNMLDFSSLALDLAGSLGVLPPALIYLLKASGFTTGMSIVIAAYSIRLALNLIPGAFTRV